MQKVLRLTVMLLCAAAFQVHAADLEARLARLPHEAFETVGKQLDAFSQNNKPGLGDFDKFQHTLFELDPFLVTTPIDQREDWRQKFQVAYAAVKILKNLETY